MMRDDLSQPPRDRVLWILANSGGKMDRSRLRRCAGIRLAAFEHMLGELTKEGRTSVDMVGIIH